MKRILVVDDESQIRTMLTQMLELEGYTVHTAEDGAEGLSLVGRYAFDLVVTDMIMPVKDGLKFIMELVRDYPDLKILAISGGGAIKAERYLTMAGYLGDIATLEKPFRRDAFLALVRKQLGIE
ncbi:response regulator [Desulfobulbus oligotrophicus]|uniref:Response regulator n=1 Tax=Desulfobulbus oligotrophicus TaxID=1909699 RepID=A0A7T5VCR8_9BACT|nr:response regulator [Desulfobulbus oligotrophicus]MDY0389660.1 response regulator [Desulfobulbus oligotrophicus]QQG65489.1 response regulator [Desulfobulbus oligotrophicus]